MCSSPARYPPPASARRSSSSSGDRHGPGTRRSIRGSAPASPPSVKPRSRTAASLSALLSLEQAELRDELVLALGPDAEFLRLVQLAPRAVAEDNAVGLLADAPARLAAEPHDR